MKKKINNCYLGLGTNMGNHIQNLEKAKDLIGMRIGTIKCASSIIDTAAWGNTDQSNFSNQVLLVTTQLDMDDLFTQTQEIEKIMGRTKTIHWGPRIIDIDILYFNNEHRASDQLTIPHPYLAERKFVLDSLNEIAADFMHPVLHKTNAMLLEELTAQEERSNRKV